MFQLPQKDRYVPFTDVLNKNPMRSDCRTGRELSDVSGI
jgi:hypothetical protein